MKSTFLISALLATVLATGCSPSSDTPAADAGDTAAQQLDQATAGKAAQQMHDCTWEGIKADSAKAYLALKDGVAMSRQWVSDTIAP